MKLFHYEEGLGELGHQSIDAVFIKLTVTFVRPSTQWSFPHRATRSLDRDTGGLVPRGPSPAPHTLTAAPPEIVTSLLVCVTPPLREQMVQNQN